MAVKAPQVVAGTLPAEVVQRYPERSRYADGQLEMCPLRVVVGTLPAGVFLRRPALNHDEGDRSPIALSKRDST